MRRLLTVLSLIASLSVMARGQLNVISTIAGGGPNAPSALSAEIIWPAGVAIDKQGNTYVCATVLDGASVFSSLRLLSRSIPKKGLDFCIIS